MFEIIVAIGLSLLAHMLMPKPKIPRPTAQDIQVPTTDAGRPTPVIFGRARIKAPSVSAYGGHRAKSKKV